MEQPARWLRARIIDALALRLTVAGGLAGGAVFLGLLARGIDWLTAVPWAVLAAQALALLRLAVESWSGVIRPRELRDHLDQHRGYEMRASPLDRNGAGAAGPGPDDEELTVLGLVPVGDVVDRTTGSVLHEGFVSASLPIPARPPMSSCPPVGMLVSRGSGDTVLVSILHDRTRVVTGHRLVATHDRTRAVFHPRLDRRELLAEHQYRCHRFQAVDRGFAPVTVDDLTELLDSETEGWRQLGPWLGSVLRIDRQRSPLIGVAVSNRELTEAP